MFYSQFILAKKGPLGTIWIAAHLERKLRKNQVADTDIGVSVDSILFPEIPIALRLSSHLLLGVVRIYSRKVNYLFDDCSEALLKIKQAFRSTAVDLPPEESTAPYHSITLPETFDLDDFELPENEIFQGNYVDRHISTREQITLQDTMDGVVYSTSQFGLDERFGDGDTSQIGLDLEEDMYLDKRGTGNDGVSDSDPQASAEARIIMSEKAAKDKGVTGAPETMAVDGNGQEVGALPATSEYDEYAQAPSTPGLVEVSNLSSVQKALACDDQMESEDHTVTDLVAMERGENAANKVDLDRRGKSAIEWSFQNDLHHESTEYVPPDDGVSPSNTMDGEKLLHNGAVSSIDRTGAEFVESPCCSHVTSEVEDVGQASNMPETHNGEVPNNVKESCTYEKELVSHAVCASESPGRPTVIDTEIHACKETKNPDNLNDSAPNGETSLPSKHGLQPCSSSLSQPDLPSPGIVEACLGETARSLEALHSSGALTEQGEGCFVADVIQSEDNQMADSISHDEIQFNRRMLDKQQTSVLASDSHLEILNKSTASDFPTAEKVLSLPEELGDKPNDFVVDSTPDKAVVAGADGVDETTKHISGKKRSFTESTLTVESFNSVESVGLTLSKRTAESIPDDDDLLSSILVGRRPSALRMKPSQPLEVVSIKRTRSAPRSTLSKRKVLMDDTMVLHGDIIRQQLTNTEDIRRIRKKAPCTHPEILMIQHQLLEEEIFLEPIAIGMSAELVSLHSERYDLSRTRVSEVGENCASSEVVKDVECSVRLDVAEKSGMLGSVRIICGNDVQVQPDETVIQAETEQSKEREFDMQCQTGVISDVHLDSVRHEPLGEKSDMEIDGRGNALVDEVNHFAYRELEMASPTGVLPEDISEIPYWGRTDITSTSMGMDLSCKPPDLGVDGQPAEKGGIIVDISNRDEVIGIEGAEHSIGDVVAVESDLKERGDFLFDEIKAGALVAIEDVQPDNPAPIANSNDSLSKTLEAGDTSQTVGESENNKLEVASPEVQVAEHGFINEAPSYNEECSGETRKCFPYTEELSNVQNASFNGVNPSLEDVDPHRALDAGITAGDRGSMECENIQVENDTEFLNVDDDEVADNDDSTPCDEEARLLENSGWSSRTRAVANYLQTLFDKEAVNGMKVLLMDNLLSGKTRKEASRMFFETLVLKTKDYIHVEQSKPFDNINIKARAKLMKSDF